MSKPLRVLIVEDSEDDTLLLVNELERGGYDTTFERVETAEAMTAALEKQEWDIIISDYRMPRFSGPAALALFKETGLDLPFIVVSGTVGEETAVATMKAGAHDYLMKDRLTRLVPAIERELYEAENRRYSKQAEEMFKSLALNSPIGIFIIQDGIFQYINPEFQIDTGYSEDELLGTDPLELVVPEDRDMVRENAIEMLKEKRSQPYEYRTINKVRDIRWAMETVASIEYNGKRATIGSYIDITARKEAEEDIIKLNEELKTLNIELEERVKERTSQLEGAVQDAEVASKAKSDFLASMSHELRTPLNAIIGFSQVLQEQYFGNLNEKQTEYINDILESGQHLLSLINDILDLSKIEAGKVELELTNVKIKDLLEGSLVMIKEKALIHGINLDMQIATELDGLEVMADDRRIKQVMFNLLSNAIKFTPDGGSISLSSKKKDKELVVNVSDTGVGISPEEFERIFEEFYQVGGTKRGKTPGTGLGLSLTKSIVEMHGGRIWVESPGKDKGSKFTFTLPAVKKSKANILVIDDEPLIRTLFETVLENRGYSVVTSATGVEGIQQVKQQNFNLVFLDLKLPDMDGADVLYEVRKENQTLPITIITGYPDSVIMDRVLKQGPLGIMKKPFTEADIATVADGHLSVSYPVSWV